jgi:hypothetical protein
LSKTPRSQEGLDFIYQLWYKFLCRSKLAKENNHGMAGAVTALTPKTATIRALPKGDRDEVWSMHGVGIHHSVKDGYSIVTLTWKGPDGRDCHRVLATSEQHYDQPLMVDVQSVGQDVVEVTIASDGSKRAMSHTHHLALRALDDPAVFPAP